MRRSKWSNDPKIGFWIDNDPIRLYYPTSILFIDEIDKNGITAPSDGWVSLYLDPYSALKSLNMPGPGQVIVVCDITTKWMMDHMDQLLKGNSETDKNRLLSKETYLKWSRKDYEYYTDLVIHIANLIPRRYISGFTI